MAIETHGKQLRGLADAYEKIQQLEEYDSETYIHLFYDEIADEIIAIEFEGQQTDDNTDTSNLIDIGCIYEPISMQEITDLIEETI